jgi:hypothetical protein
MPGMTVGAGKNLSRAQAVMISATGFFLASHFP